MIHINKERAGVLKDLLLWLENEKYPFGHLKRAQLPHRDENLPTNMTRGGKEHALFLFYCCLWMKGPIQSDTAIRLLARLHESNPEIFQPNVASQLESEYLEGLFASVGLNMRKWNSRYWVRNSQILRKKWDSNPLNIYEGLPSGTKARWAELLTRIRRDHKKKTGFWGFQDKMVSMITYYLMESGLIDVFLFPIPIDFHAIRIAIAFGIIEVKTELGSNSKYVEEVRSEVRKFIFDYCIENGINPIRLCDAIWMFSRSMCSVTPGALAKVDKKDSSGRELRGRFRKVHPTKPDWTKKSHLRAYANSCGACPVEPECQLMLRSAHYYVRGRVIPEKRPKPKIEQLSSVLLERDILNGDLREVC